MFPDGTTISPNLTVTTNDGGLYGSGHGASLPRGMRVKFSSDHPKVVSVAKGKIQTVANGVATITATVTYHRRSASGKFVVRVLSELNSITLKIPAAPAKGKNKKQKGKGTSIPLRGFEPDQFSYDVIVPAGVHLPRISATTADKRAHIRTGQLGRLPGTARIRITGPDGLTQTYRLYFARPARSDTFSGSNVGTQWTWIRRDPANEGVAGGALQITTQPGDLSSGTRPGTNLLVQPALGNWRITTRLTLSSPPTIPGQQAGIIAYQDDQNYLEFAWENSGGKTELVETSEDNLSGPPTVQSVATYPTNRVRNTVWLRIVKRGAHYTTYFSPNGHSWVPVYTVGAPLQNVQVGLFAWNGPAASGNLRASFGYFKVNNVGPLNLGSLH
jgi:regulation of enolase protein 1 (concanavalin A-like superfamily)